MQALVWRSRAHKYGTTWRTRESHKDHDPTRNLAPTARPSAWTATGGESVCSSALSSRSSATASTSCACAASHAAASASTLAASAVRSRGATEDFLKLVRVVGALQELAPTIGFNNSRVSGAGSTPSSLRSKSSH